MRVAGIGFRQGVPLDTLRGVLRAVEALGGPAEALASLPEKAADARLQSLAAERGLPLYPVAVAGLATPTRSLRIMARHGTGSVAEAAALAACGPGAKITVARITAPDGMATCAMAETEETKT
ncbi:cobalamin biosynthesis protein [Tabrizicola oligotrophica]|uniref:Cobalamin biosynthesis protein n=1 Tax=Tabrizicola oligotrophica TaxID=2710650 RepID=A0A6M0QVS8_9RHOB|nr:cobalamin biosynthesis protein [Tabrizicola oligotrophica]NEY91530.1 cobalamin biosynthesis protein [Tabrizicola oligotrophica]